MTSVEQALVVDNGSGQMKAGYAGDDAPNAVFPAVVGTQKMQGTAMIGIDTQEHYIGEEAQVRRGVLILTYPISAGFVTDWAKMTQVWTYLYYQEMRVDPADYNALLTEAPMNPTSNRENMLKIHFEDYDVQGFSISVQAMLSLYAAGRTTGLILDSGDGVTHTVPVYEGYAMVHAMTRMDLAGRNLTTYMSVLITKAGCSLSTSAEKEIARDIKEKTCYVAEDPELEKAKAKEEIETDFELPDGRVIKVASERWLCPEALFDPMVLGQESEGMHGEVCRAIQACDMDVRRELYKNIVCSGGTTMYPGLGSRITDEIKKKTPTTTTTKVMLPPERKYSVWIGGSILATLSSFQPQWITRLNYEELGPQVCLMRCY